MSKFQQVEDGDVPAGLGVLGGDLELVLRIRVFFWPGGFPPSVNSEHTKLRLAREGLEAIQRITTPIAAVAGEGDRNIDQFTHNNKIFVRTKLCDMKDNELDQLYVKRREQLKKLVATIIRPKVVQGKPLNGKDFVAFLEQVLLHEFVFIP
ncbi:hypothetical protein B296_00011445 [Ensete ventricosum]|uniref:Uncharacterized protein n=1 Tax=Ensete ventricosum TaxID=4639 RepID=A0A426ZR62_ENSVE|nr:hypothetical protein B296_00011445 [Ensete ventricosum]